MGLSRRPRGPLPWRRALETLALTVCLGVWTQPASAQGATADVINTQVGQTATLTAPVTVNLLTFSWYRGTGVTDESQRICTHFAAPASLLTGPQYTGRETCQPGGSLEIRDLLTNYTGNYTVTVSPSGAAPVTATRQLRVYEPVTKPRVTWVPSQLVENKGPAEITCNDSTAATTILWSFNNSPDLPGNILPSPDNRTLTIANVSRGDSGIYQCVAVNPVSNSTSDPQTLSVAFGPELVKIVPLGPLFVQIGTKLSLKCTAESFPDPRYQWSLNGTQLNSTAGTYIKEKVSFQDGGIYTCVAENTVTNLTANTSVSVSVVTEYVPTVASKIDGLSDGAIAGIVIAALVVLAGVAALVYFFVFKKSASGAATTGNSTEMAPNNNEGSASPKANGTAAEIQYSSVNFVPKRGTPAKPVAPENTVYSEVRR